LHIYGVFYVYTLLSNTDSMIYIQHMQHTK